MRFASTGVWRYNSPPATISNVMHMKYAKIIFSPAFFAADGFLLMKKSQE
jgi:hypothetical protein